ncbi:hypothetical protein Y032_0281g1261 [Ancylostoma ceylanicum]|nr:hypothetical protein Y032_0281g1261 [Ancylostoma ceylanicum]
MEEVLKSRCTAPNEAAAISTAIGLIPQKLNVELNKSQFVNDDKRTFTASFKELWKHLLAGSGCQDNFELYQSTQGKQYEQMVYDSETGNI